MKNRTNVPTPSGESDGTTLINMKVFKAQFDSVIITMLANSFDDSVLLLKEKDSGFYTDLNGRLKYRWNEKDTDFVDLKEEKIERGIIRWESH